MAPLVRYDSASSRSFLLTFKTVAIECSLFPGGLLFQNHYPRFRGAPSGFFKDCPQVVFRWIRVKHKADLSRSCLEDS